VNERPSTISDPNLLTVADVEHSETEERWFSAGIAANGVLLSVVYMWLDVDSAAIKIRLISARRATPLSADNTRKSYE